jgi:hypothetical protein
MEQATEAFPQAGEGARAVQFNQNAVDQFLIVDIRTDKRRGNFMLNVMQRFLHIFAGKDAAAIAQFHRFVHPARGPGGCHTATEQTIFQMNFNLNCRPAAGIPYTTTNHIFNATHNPFSFLQNEVMSFNCLN